MLEIQLIVSGVMICATFFYLGFKFKGYLQLKQIREDIKDLEDKIKKVELDHYPPDVHQEFELSKQLVTYREIENEMRKWN